MKTRLASILVVLALPLAARAERIALPASNCAIRAVDESTATQAGAQYGTSGLFSISNMATAAKTVMCPVDLRGTGNGGPAITSGVVFVTNYSAADPVTCTLHMTSGLATVFNAQSSSGAGFTQMNFPSLGSYFGDRFAGLSCRIPAKQGTSGISHLHNYAFTTP